MTQRGQSRSSKFSQLGLGLIFLTQLLLFVLLVTEASFPLPDFALASVKEASRRKGLDLHYESISFTLSGTLLAEEVVLRSTNVKVPPLVKIDQFVLYGKPWNLLTGAGFARRLEIRGAEALFHENVDAEPMLNKVDLEVDLLGGNTIVALSGKFGDASVWFDAEADLDNLFPKRKGPPKTPFLMRPDFPKFYSSLIRTLDQVKSSLQNAERSYIAGRLSKSENGHFFSLDAQAERIADDKDIAFEKAMAHFALRQKEKLWLVDGQPVLRVQKGRLPGRGNVTTAKLQVNAANGSLRDLGRNLRADLRLEGFGIEGPNDFNLESIDAQIEIHDLDRMEASLLAKADRLHLVLDADYHISERSGSITGRGELFPEDLRSERLRDLDQRNMLRAPEGLSLLMAKVSLGPASSIKEAVFRATGRNLTYRGVRVDRAKATARYLKGGDWLLDPLAIELGNSHANGSYARKSTRDYRFLLKGVVRPEKINPLMGNWWIRLWQDFQIGASPPAGDFDVSGRWRDPSGNRRNVFGSVRFDSLSYRNLPVESGRVIILADSNRTIARDLELDLENGWVKGELSWEKYSSVKGPAVTSFELQGAVTPSDCLDAFGPNTRETLLKFESEEPIYIKAKGVTRQERHASDLHLEVNATEPMRYKNIPLDALSFELRQKGAITKISDLEFNFAGGTGKGSVVNSTVNENPRLDLTLELTGAERKKVVEAFRLSKMFTVPVGSGEIETPSRNVDENHPSDNRGVLDFELSAEGNPNDPLSFKGGGQIDLRDANLGSIRLFGPLSKILQASPLPLPSGSVNFTRLKGPFDLHGAQATFKDLSITSSTAAIRINGQLWLKDRRIAGSASFSLLGGLVSKIPKIGEIANKVNPLPTIVPLKLFGSLDDPQWSLK